MIIKNADEFNLGWLKRYLVNHTGYIAGGCFKDIFTGKKVHDLDIFFVDMDAFLNAFTMFSRNDDYIAYYESEKVVAYKHKETGIICELNRTRFGCADDVIGDFDYTISKFAMYWGHDAYEVVYHNDYFEHLFLRRLVIDDKLLYPSLERLLKYVRKGYNPCRETKVKLLEAFRTAVGDPISASLYNGID